MSKNNFCLKLSKINIVKILNIDFNMKNLKDIFGLKVISFEQGEALGYVLDICLDEKLNRLVGLVIVDNESENEYFLPVEKIKAQNEEGVFIATASDTQASMQEMNNPIGKIVYDKTGANLGKVIDLTLLGRKIDKIITSKGEIKQKYIETSGRDYLIFSRKTSKKKTGTINFQPKFELKLTGNVKIMSAPQISTPSKVVVEPSMLLNKTTTSDIFGYNNEIIIKKNEIITQKTIEKAKKHNKLNYLMFNSK